MSSLILQLSDSCSPQARAAIVTDSEQGDAVVAGEPFSAGWFPDPSGVHQLRYFDNGWTDHVSDAGAVSWSPLHPVQQPDPTGRKRRALLIAGVSVGAVVVAVVVLFVAGAFSTTGPSNAVSIAQFCSDLSSTYDGEVSAAVADVNSNVTTAQINTASTDTTKLADEAPDSTTKTIMTDTIADLQSALSAPNSTDTTKGVSDTGAEAGWETLHCQ